MLHIKIELEESQKKINKNHQQEKALKEELESLKIQYMDMQRVERTVRMDLEKSKQTVQLFCFIINQKHFKFQNYLIKV